MYCAPFDDSFESVALRQGKHFDEAHAGPAVHAFATSQCTVGAREVAMIAGFREVFRGANPLFLDGGGLVADDDPAELRRLAC